MPIKRGVFIGINYVGQSSKLNGCYNDAIALLKFVEKTCGIDEAILLTDEKQGYELPTKKNIIRAIQWLVKDAKKDDCLIFTYSGHGSQTMCPDDLYETDGVDETIVPLDYQKEGQISDCVLRYHLVNFLPAGVKLTCVFDSCFSSSVLDIKYNLVADVTTPPIANVPYAPNDSNLSPTIISKLNKLPEVYFEDCGYSESNADVCCISGCMDTQTSADAMIDWKSSGAMTWSLLTTLNNTENITYVDLIQHMRSLLKGKYTQIPQMHFSKNINPNDIFSIATPTTYVEASTGVTMPKEAIMYEKISRGLKTADSGKIIIKHIKHLKQIKQLNLKKLTKYIPLIDYIPWINKWV